MSLKDILEERVKVLIFAYLPRDMDVVEKAIEIAKTYAGYIIELKKFGMQELVGIAVDTKKSKADSIKEDIKKKLMDIGARDIVVDILPSMCII